jgi:hypothetical protein
MSVEEYKKKTNAGINPNERKPRPGRYKPNTQENKQVTGAMREAGVEVTPENKEKVHREISGENLSYKELVAVIKNLFKITK